jgi:hypothetical protein
MKPRRPDTMNSRLMMSTTIHTGSSGRAHGHAVRKMSPPETMILSTTGSAMRPKSVCRPSFRA